MSKFAYNVNLKKILTGIWNDNMSTSLEKQGAEYGQT